MLKEKGRWNALSLTCRFFFQTFPFHSIFQVCESTMHFRCMLLKIYLEIVLDVLCLDLFLSLPLSGICLSNLTTVLIRTVLLLCCRGHVDVLQSLISKRKNKKKKIEVDIQVTRKLFNQHADKHTLLLINPPGFTTNESGECGDCLTLLFFF